MPGDNPYGFNPLEIVVPLGQKPLASAYRQSSNVYLVLFLKYFLNFKMAKAPPPQRFKLKKMIEKLPDSNLTNISSYKCKNDITEEKVSTKLSSLSQKKFNRGNFLFKFIAIIKLIFLTFIIIFSNK